MRHRSDDEILDAARTCVLQRGARAATVDAIAALSGVPRSSFYYRVTSLDDLLAETWIRAERRSQTHFLAALDEPDPMDASVAAALALYDFAAGEPDDARLLASMRPDDLFDRAVLPHVEPELVQLERRLEAAFEDLARRLFGRASNANVETTIYTVADLPQCALRRHLIAGTELPPSLRPQVEADVREALVWAGVTHANASRSSTR